MQTHTKLALMLVVAATLFVAAPVAADDSEPVQDLDVCVNISTDPPGVAVDPWCTLPPPASPRA